MSYLPVLKDYLKKCIKEFQAGCLSKYFTVWESLTSDPEVLQTVKGLKLEFDEFPLSSGLKYEVNTDDVESLKTEVNKLLKKGVIVPCDHEKEEFISPIFLRDKPDGSKRLILNLKTLNKNLEYKHFKMETLQSVLTLVQPNCFMATIDIKDAYYSVKIWDHDTSFLKFILDSKLFKFVALPNGLSPGPRKFTKLTKPPIAVLRLQGHTIAIYIDDLFTTDNTFEDCLHSVIEVIRMFQKLGFIIHPEKSQFISSKEITYLGFVINSEKMIVYLSDKKKDKLYKKCCTIAENKGLKIRNVASFIGSLTSSFPGNKMGPLYYRALKHNKGNFNSKMKLTEGAC